MQRYPADSEDFADLEPMHVRELSDPDDLFETAVQQFIDATVLLYRDNREPEWVYLLAGFDPQKSEESSKGRMADEADDLIGGTIMLMEVDNDAELKELCCLCFEHRGRCATAVADRLVSTAEREELLARYAAEMEGDEDDEDLED